MEGALVSSVGETRRVSLIVTPQNPFPQRLKTLASWLVEPLSTKLRGKPTHRNTVCRELCSVALFFKPAALMTQYFRSITHDTLEVLHTIYT